MEEGEKPEDGRLRIRSIPSSSERVASIYSNGMYFARGSRGLVVKGTWIRAKIFSHLSIRRKLRRSKYNVFKEDASKREELREKCFLRANLNETIIFSCQYIRIELIQSFKIR